MLDRRVVARKARAMILWLALATLAPTALLSAVVRFAPARVARIPFLPIRESATLVIPAPVAEIVAPPLAGSGTYRGPLTRDIALAALPGAPRADRQRCVIRFMPELRCILAYPGFAPGRLLRVDITDDGRTWLLRARRFPGEELGAALLGIALIGGWLAGFQWRGWMIVAIVLGDAYAVLKARRAAGATFDAVRDELSARIAIANGEKPPPSERSLNTGSRVTGPDEWTCGCGEVNPRERGMCRRCWSQRPAE